MLRQALIVGLILSTASAAAQPLSTYPTEPYYRAFCTMFEHRDMKGARLPIRNKEWVVMIRRTEADNLWRDRPGWNDIISSAHLDPGCRLRVYEHINGEGAGRTWQAKPTVGLNIYYVGSWWNDRISSATCRCTAP